MADANLGNENEVDEAGNRDREQHQFPKVMASSSQQQDTEQKTSQQKLAIVTECNLSPAISTTSTDQASSSQAVVKPKPSSELAATSQPQSSTCNAANFKPPRQPSTSSGSKKNTNKQPTLNITKRSQSAAVRQVGALKAHKTRLILQGFNVNRYLQGFPITVGSGRLPGAPVRRDTANQSRESQHPTIAVAQQDNGEQPTAPEIPSSSFAGAAQEMKTVDTPNMQQSFIPISGQQSRISIKQMPNKLATLCKIGQFKPNTPHLVLQDFDESKHQEIVPTVVGRDRIRAVPIRGLGTEKGRPPQKVMETLNHQRFPEKVEQSGPACQLPPTSQPQASACNSVKITPEPQPSSITNGRQMLNVATQTPGQVAGVRLPGVQPSASATVAKSSGNRKQDPIGTPRGNPAKQSRPPQNFRITNHNLQIQQRPISGGPSQQQQPGGRYINIQERPPQNSSIPVASQNMNRGQFPGGGQFFIGGGHFPVGSGHLSVGGGQLPIGGGHFPVGGGQLPIGSGQKRKRQTVACRAPGRDEQGPDQLQPPQAVDAVSPLTRLFILILFVQAILRIDPRRPRFF